MRKLISITLSILILLSSTGVVFSQHLCGDKVLESKITLGEAILSCGMTHEAKSSCDATTIDKRSCCGNEYVKIDTDNHYNKAHFQLEFSSFTIVETPYFSTLEAIEFSQEEAPSFLHYRPPPLQKDYQVLLETFLI